MFLDEHFWYTFVENMRHRINIRSFKGVQAKFQEVGGGHINNGLSDGTKEYLALQNSSKGGPEHKSISPPYIMQISMELLSV